MQLLVTYFVPFAAGIVLDFLYVLWVASCQERQPVRAGLYSGLIGAAGLVALVEALTRWQGGIAYVLGLSAGSYIGVRFAK